MNLFFTSKPFEYIHPVFKHKIETDSIIPFFINNRGEAVNLVNYYLLSKSDFEWKYKENTKDTNARHLLSFLNYIDINKIHLDEATFDVILSFIHYLKGSYSENTILNRLNSIQSLYDWLFKHNFIETHPFDNLSSKIITKNIFSFSKKNGIKTFDVNSIKSHIIKDISTEDIPSEKDIKIIHNNLNNEYKLMFLLYLTTGMRKNELLQLKPSMFYDAKDNGDGYSYSLLLDANEIDIKNNKSRIVILNGALRNRVIKHLNSKTYKKRLIRFREKHPNKEAVAFISLFGNKYASNTLNIAFDKANENKEKKITIHSLRHYYATHFIYFKEKQGECLENAYFYLSQRLGHSNVETTKAFYIKTLNKIKQQNDMSDFSYSIIEGIINE